MKNKKRKDKESKKLYIAYGSNLNLSQMKYRCPTAKVIGSYEIRDYELVFRGFENSAVATIEASEGSKVPVLLWEIQIEDEKELDRYEGYPSFYGKENFEIEINDKTVSAMVYIMTQGYELGIPSENYRKAIEEGYIDAGFDKTVLKDAIDKTKSKMEAQMKDKDKQSNLFEIKWW